MLLGQIEVDTEAQTERLAGWLAETLEPPLVIALNGPLGAGKTFFVRAFAAALEVPREQVVSPTFTLCQTYEGRERLHHLDAYRLGSTAEFEALGPDEWFGDDAFTLLEWAEKVTAALPSEYLELRVEPLDEVRRRFDFIWHGSTAPFFADKLKSRLGEFG